MGTQERIDHGIALDTLFSEENRRNPHPLYHRLRSAEPMAHLEEMDEWIFTRWADCEAVLRDPRWSSSPEHRPTDNSYTLPVDANEVGLKTLLFLDPPDHTRLSRLVSKAFTPRRLESIREHVGEILDELLRDVRPGEPFDVISTFAYPLPLIVICELMGVPLEDRHQFEGWSYDATRLLDGDIDEETFNKGLLASMYFLNYFNHLFTIRRANPGDDLLSGLLAVEESGDVLSEEELRSIVMLLFLAGHETTVNLIGNGLFALMQQRDQWELFCSDPAGLAPGAVEELLRFDGPVHVTGRIATEEVEIAGRVFPKQSQVVTLLAAANRDPERFPDPDSLDITRTDNHHLTFSHGIHYCLGAALARLEGQVAIGSLIRRFPDVELAAPPVYRDHFVLRGLTELRVTV